MIQALQIALVVACIAYVHCVVLPNTSNPLEGLYTLLYKLEKVAPWLAKPLGACSLCFAGQLGLWTSIIIGLPWHLVIATAALSITLTSIIITWLERN